MDLTQLVLRWNVTRYRALLDGERDEKTRALLLRLIAECEAKLPPFERLFRR